MSSTARISSQAPRTLPERNANANLISAAPDLLGALRSIIDSLPSHRDWLDPNLEQFARAAIDKAEGKES